MATTLPEGARLGPYEILGLLGAGGMGEVYRARDPRLGRSVALKILPAEFSADSSRAWRFEREAKAVASLNHPHICTVHDIGEHDGHRYLVMEMMEGQPLDARLRSGALPLPLLIDLSLQIADALEAAHAAGVIHRDLKPANIFITKRNEAKLLDFGLAKLAGGIDGDTGAERGNTATDPGERVTMLSPSDKTTLGTVLGTAAYMSPEQARGEAVDTQSDLFSFGVVLYEMAAGALPFVGTTMPLLFDGILNRPPIPLAEVKPDLPIELVRIVDKALEKDRDFRYRSAADMRSDLRRLRRDSGPGRIGDSGTMLPPAAVKPPSAVGASVLPPQTPTPASVATPSSDDGGRRGKRRRERRRRWPIILAIIAGSWGVRNVFRDNPDDEPRRGRGAGEISLESLQVTQLTSTGNAFRPAISPDGNYVVYLEGAEDGASVWLRQTGEASSVKILSAEAGRTFLGATVGPGSTFVDAQQAGGGLWRVPFLGGAPKLLIDRVSTPVGWAPDGKHMAFIRPTSGGGQDLVIADPDGSDQRALVTQPPPGFVISIPGSTTWAPAWSPDGENIATLQRHGDDVRNMAIVVFDAEDGDARSIDIRGDVPLGLGWFDNRTLLLAQALESGTPSQIWQIEFPDGRRSRLTNDISRYSELSLSADANSFVTSRPESRVSLWVGDAKGEGVDISPPRPFLSSAVNYATVGWDGDRVLFTHTLNGHYEIFRVAPTRDAAPDVVVSGRELAVAPDGTVVYRSVADQGGLWKADRQGRQATELVKGTVSYPFVSPDGQRVMYSAANGGPQTLWYAPLAGGTPTQMLSQPVGLQSFSDISPDGTSIVLVLDRQWTLCDFPACATRRPIGPVAGTRPRWLPDGRAFSYISGGSNIWMQPIDGSTPRQLTHLTEGTIGDHAWSRSGKLVVSRALSTSDIVLFRGLRGSDRSR